MGLETLYELYKDSAKSRLHEILICFHSLLLEKNLKCIGKSYDGSHPTSDLKGSELLPSGWNEDVNSVELHYMDVATKDVYKVIALNESGSCLLHLIAVPDSRNKSAFVELTTNDHINETSHKTVSQVYRNLDGFKKIVNEQLIAKVLSGAQAEQSEAAESLYRDPREYYQQRAGADNEGPSRSVDPLRDYGRADLDPFYVEPGGFGTSPPSGMLFDPFRHVRPRAPDRFSGLIQPLPRGSVPPGARFDPFGPPGTGRPDPDLEKKPSFNDDFYS